MNLNQAITYRGTKKPMYPTNGDMYTELETGINYLYLHRRWEPVALVSEMNTEPPKKIKITRCSGCGANLPLDKVDKESGLCECRFCSRIEYVWE